MGAYTVLDKQNELCYGLENNAKQLRYKQDGVVKAKASIISKGKTVQVWEIKIEDEEEKLLCISRCTVAVKQKRG